MLDLSVPGTLQFLAPEKGKEIRPRLLVKHSPTPVRKSDSWVPGFAATRTLRMREPLRTLTDCPTTMGLLLKRTAMSLRMSRSRVANSSLVSSLFPCPYSSTAAATMASPSAFTAMGEHHRAESVLKLSGKFVPLLAPSSPAHPPPPLLPQLRLLPLSLRRSKVHRRAAEGRGRALAVQGLPALLQCSATRIALAGLDTPSTWWQGGIL